MIVFVAGRGSAQAKRLLRAFFAATPPSKLVMVRREGAAKIAAEFAKVAGIEVGHFWPDRKHCGDQATAIAVDQLLQFARPALGLVFTHQPVQAVDLLTRAGVPCLRPLGGSWVPAVVAS